MNIWMNNKFNKQEFPTGNVKQIILQSALNFNQSLSITLVPVRSSASTESALGNTTVFVEDPGRVRWGACRWGIPAEAAPGCPWTGGAVGYWCITFPSSCFSHTPAVTPELESSSFRGWLRGGEVHSRWMDRTEQQQETDSMHSRNLCQAWANGMIGVLCVKVPCEVCAESLESLF